MSEVLEAAGTSGTLTFQDRVLRKGYALMPRPRSTGNWTRRWILVAVAVLLAGLLGPSSKQVFAWQQVQWQQTVHPLEKFAADKILRNAAEHTNAGQWNEAVDLYQKVIDQYGESVTKTPNPGSPTDSVLFVDIRMYCQEKLLKLPAEGLKVYRDRVDSTAERWYRKGATERDALSLRKVVEQSFASSWGDDAVDLLGDLAFQEGRFNEALVCYRRIVPDEAAAGRGLVYPDPSVDLAVVAAKKLLCRAAIGEKAPTPEELAAYREQYKAASGKLAGRNGLLYQIVESAIEEDHLAVTSERDGRWPTFAGAPSRSRVAPDAIDVGSKQWQVPLTLGSGRRDTAMFPRQNGFGAPMAGGGERRLPFHPIILGDQVLICDGRMVRAYNLNDRSADPNGFGPVDVAWLHDQFPASGPPRAAIPASDSPQFTLTAYGDRIFARMENMSDGRINQPGAVVTTSRIVAIDRSAEGKLLWKRDCSDIPLGDQAELGAGSSGFEGTPVADAENVYVAITVVSPNGFPAAYIACLSAETGDPKWVRFLFQFNAKADFQQFPRRFNRMWIPTVEIGHKLLSLEGGMLFYQSNAGAVAALDGETGSIRWIASYPGGDANGMASSRKRNLNPAVVHDGLAIVAPDDTPLIVAFDAATGRMVWKLDPQTEVVHLLGVAKGRLVATGDHVVTIDVKTGKRLTKWPDHPAGFDGCGRGILAGDSIFWPTKTEIHVLDQSTGLRGNQPPIKLKEMFQVGGGNLAAGNGYLAVAQADSLVVFCQNNRLIQRYRDAIARQPDEAVNYYDLARVAEAAGQEDVALESLDRAIAKAKSSEMLDGRLLSETSKERKYRLLVNLGAQSLVQGRLGCSCGSLRNRRPLFAVG